MGKPCHALVIPYPGQSHITPMMQLSKHLALAGFHITFLNTGHNHRRLLHSQAVGGPPLPPHFSLVELPQDDLPAHYYNSYEHVYNVYEYVNLPGFREKVEKVLEENPSVTCIISHHYLSWGHQVAHKFGIPNVVYWSVMATLCCLYMQFPLLLSKGYLPLKCKKEKLAGMRMPLVEDVEGIVPTLPLAGLPRFFQIEDVSDPHYEFINRQLESLRQAKWLLVNTFDSLETKAMKALRSKFSVYSVGPLLPPSLVSHQGFEPLWVDRVGSALWPEDNHCLQWLDSQVPQSVIYVSFGSVASLTDSQIQELAKGIETSQQPFLWALRPNAITSGHVEAIDGMKGFIERTRKRGMVVSWAPQTLVLKHPSVGGFLSHCGWNSTVESISMGVPILGYPMMAQSEQNTNAWFVEHHWKVGFSIRQGESVEAEEVEKKMRDLIKEERGRNARSKSREWMDMAREAQSEGGTSHASLDAFVTEMRKEAAALRSQKALLN